jgi:hypothetical protein
MDGQAKGREGNVHARSCHDKNRAGTGDEADIQDEDKHQGHDIRWVMPIRGTGISAGGGRGVWGSSRIGISDRDDAGRCWLHEMK